MKIKLKGDKNRRAFLQRAVLQSAGGRRDLCGRISLSQLKV